MKLVSRKNFLLTLAAILVVALGVMALTLYKQAGYSSKSSYEREVKDLKSQSSSDNIDDIEDDVEKTEFSEVDKELQDIDNELNQVSY